MLLKLKQSQYFIRGTTRPEYAGTIINLQIVMNTQKISTLIKVPQNIFTKIFLPNKIPKLKKFQTQKDPSIIPVTWNPEYRPPWFWADYNS